MASQAGRTDRKLGNASWLTSGSLPQLLAVLDRDGEEARAVGGAVRNGLLAMPVLAKPHFYTPLPRLRYELIIPTICNLGSSRTTLMSGRAPSPFLTGSAYFPSVIPVPRNLSTHWLPGRIQTRIRISACYY